MSRTKVEKTGSYVAVDAEGNEHRINVFTTFNEVRLLSGVASWHPGLQAHKTSLGHHVNVNDDGSLTDVHTGLTMRLA